MDKNNQSQYKMSVVVPVYNGAAYVLRCCNNLIKQTLADIQIIFVDDGSKDESLKLMQRCSEKYPNVMVLHQENRGVSVARNHGLEYATGEFVGFVDVDDSFEVDMFQTLYELAVENHLDILGMEYVGKQGEFKIFEKTTDCLALLFTQKIRMAVWNKIFRNSKKLVHFPEGIRINEDLMAVYDAFCRADRIGTIYINKYEYNQQENSSSRVAVFGEKYFDAITIADEIYARTAKDFPELAMQNEARKARTYMRITKTYYMRGMPKEYLPRIQELRKYLRSLDKTKLTTYFGKYDVVRYLLYIYCKPLFVLFVKKFDK